MNHSDVLATPHLSYDPEMDRWILSLQRSREGEAADVSYSMAIRCAWNDVSWFDYRYLKYDCGDCTQLVTMDEYNLRVNDIEQNESDKIAALWQEHQTSVEIVRDNHPVFALRRHWEAMMTLGLFFPSVNHKEWAAVGKPLPPAI